MRRLRIGVGIAIALAAVAAGAWIVVRWDATYMMRAPNASSGPHSMAIPPEVQRSLRVPVGPPNAELELWILDPPQTPRATVLVLHGLRDSKAGSMEAAVKIAEEGMRAILVDLRGHGG